MFSVIYRYIYTNKFIHLNVPPYNNIFGLMNVTAGMPQRIFEELIFTILDAYIFCKFRPIMLLNVYIAA